MRESGVFPSRAEDWKTVASVLYRAFSEDENLRTLKRFRVEEFPDFFHLSCEFFMESGNLLSWIYWDEGEPAGALLAIPYNWSAPVSFLWRFFLKFWKKIGWRSFSSVFTIIKSSWLSRPRKPCLRILFLGVVSGARCKGIGKELLKEAERASVFPSLQLEVEKENLPAVSLYLKEGFKKQREFRLGKVTFLVMVKELSQKEEPDQGENRDQYGD